MRFTHSKLYLLGRTQKLYLCELNPQFLICRFYNNAYYAKVGGVTTAELNRLEMKFLFGLDFRLHVSLRTFGRYCSELEKEVSYELQIERPPRVALAACGLKDTWSSSDDSSSYATAEIQIVQVEFRFVSYLETGFLIAVVECIESKEDFRNKISEFICTLKCKV